MRGRQSGVVSANTVCALSERFGVIDGSRLTILRIGSCHRPNGGYDPVPDVLPWKATMQSSVESVGIGQQKVPAHKVAQQDLPVIGDRKAQFSFENFEHGFKLMLAYPREREFYSPDEFQKKIAEFYENVLQISQYAIAFRVDRVSAGVINDEYVCRFEGSASGDLLHFQSDEIVNLIVAQLEGFFVVVQHGEFRPLYFEVDGQVVIQPQPDDKVLPEGYRADNYWWYTSDDAVWDLYWGSYIVEDLFNALFSVSADIIDGISSGMEAAEPVIPEGGDSWLQPPTDSSVSDAAENFPDNVGDVASAGMDAAAMSEIGDGIDVPSELLDDSGVLDGVGDIVDNAGEVIGEAVSAIGDVTGHVVSSMGETASGCNLDGCNLDGCFG